MKYQHSFVILVLAVVFSGCVTSKKYGDLEKQHIICKKQNDSLQILNQDLRSLNAESSTQIDVLNKLVNDLKSDTTRMGSEMRYLKTKNTELANLNALLEDNYAKCLKGSQTEMTKLMDELKDAQLKLLEREEELRLKSDRLKDLEEALAQKDKDVLALKNKLMDALKGFKDSGLTIEIKNGKVYVSMSEKLLFATGSTEVDPKGIEALKELAKVLEKEKDINIMVEGHTDNIPFKGTGTFKDNWDLSVARANVITRIILANGKIDPVRITSAGRGEFFPLVTNDTPENRAKNRRTEIILTPKLDELFDIMK